MAVSAVHIEADACMTCLTHVLSTESEEVMGLLIGEVDQHRILHISAVIMLQRSDKQPDRVEISPEQLSDASTQAERLAYELERPMRVLGWYHSHPHITVWPSHVDVRTQAMYQMMDEGFIGIIFSVFNEDKSTKVGRIQVTCFQSINQSVEGEPEQFMRIEIPFHIIPHSTLAHSSLQSLIKLPAILSQEEEEAYSSTTRNTNLDPLTNIHNASVYSQSLCRIMEVLTGQVMKSLENKLKRNAIKADLLQKEKEQLLQQLKNQSVSNVSSRQDSR